MLIASTLFVGLFFVWYNLDEKLPLLHLYRN